MGHEGAIELGQTALIWLSNEPEALGAFLGASGIAPDEVRLRAAEPEFLGFVLDFLLGDEPMLLAFCRDTGVAPTWPASARAILPGGDLPHWT